MLVLALLVTLIVLLIDVSLKSRSDNSVERLSGQAWIDQVLPVVRTSTADGQQLNTIRTNWESMNGATISSDLKRIEASTAASYKAVQKLVPPARYGSAGGLLQACLLLREQGAKAMANTLLTTLAGPVVPAPDDATAIASAGQKLQLGDQVYGLFAQNLPGLGVTMPPSAWIGDKTLYQQAPLRAFLASMRSKVDLQPVHRVVIESYTTTPQPETVKGHLQVIPYSPTFTVGVVVANTGNQEEDDVTVDVETLPAVKQPSLRESLGPLAPGAQVSLSIGPLFPLSGQPVTLTMAVAGSTDLPPATKTVMFEMPTPGTSPTTATSQAG